VLCRGYQWGAGFIAGDEDILLNTFCSNYAHLAFALGTAFAKRFFCLPVNYQNGFFAYL
jgi:hypothetical protein